LAEDRLEAERWIVEVRAKRSFSRRPADWLALSKINRLKKMSTFLAAKTERAHRILFVQVLLKKLEQKKDLVHVKVNLDEFEIGDF